MWLDRYLAPCRTKVMERCALHEREYHYFRKLSKDNLLVFYILLISGFFITLFLCGFLSGAHYDHEIASDSNIPKYIGNLRIETDLLYGPMIKRLIFMVIDGLRWDFVAGPTGKIAMPLTSDMLANADHGCLMRALLQAPTVTMPRIKAMMTGTVPNFVDVILNFGNKSLHSDNLLFQAKARGHKLIFYGDETWLTLFPNIFDRHDGTTSFLVTDFTEVDNNVTRHIRDELNNNDWDVMILHYLGLDHIGHVEGPFGPSVKPKLQEMDKIVDQIAQKVWDWNDNAEPTLFIVCGDHGMKDSGGHGGLTPEEATVPLIAIGGDICFSQEDELRSPIMIQQHDVAVTLSAALGLPIPSTNLGSVFLDRIFDLEDAQRLFLFNYNSRQLFDHFQKLFHKDQIEYMYQKYLNAVDLHLDWLNSNETQRYQNTYNVALSYQMLLSAMEDLITSYVFNYDLRLICVALMGILQIVSIAFYVETAVWHKKTPSFFFVGFCLCLGLYDLYSFGDTTSFYPTSILKAMLFLLIIGVFYINCNLLLNNWECVLTLELNIYKKFEIITLMHIISFCGSSYIEEEHQTWYFFWSTLITYLVYKYFTELLALMMHHRDNIVQSIQYYVERFAMLLLLFLGHIFLRNLNRTGNKWAHLPDIAGWLKEDDSKIGVTLLLLTALALLIWIAYKCEEEEEYKQQSLFRNTAIAVCIYLRHMSNGAVVKIPLYSSSGIYEVYMFWGIIVICLITTYGCRVIRIIKDDRNYFTDTILFFIINIWVMISAMLHQPYNVILLPMQIIVSLIIDTLLKENKSSKSLDSGVALHYWLGNVFYFYQGNSNSIGSVNVAAGYVGLQSYMPFVTAVYLIINTYSAPVLAYFLLIYRQQTNIYLYTNIEGIVYTNKRYIAWRLLTIAFYMYLTMFQRNHLFVLSVYVPKMLYEVTYTATMCCSALLTMTIIAVQHAMISFENAHDVHRCNNCETGIRNRHMFA